MICFPKNQPKYHTFFNTKIFHENPIIEYNFFIQNIDNDLEWLFFLEYANIKARAGYSTKIPSSIFLNNVDISDQTIDNFYPYKYKHLLTKNNNIKILVYDSWNYLSHMWVYPISLSAEETNDYISKELDLWK